MSARIAALSASLLLSLAATAASAADLGGAPPDEGRYYPPYSGESRSGYTHEEEEYYEESRRGDDYLPPVREGRRYAERDDGVCLPRHEIRRQLADHGWHDFRHLDRRGDVAVLEARRPSGRVYELRVDSCSGRILRTYALDGRPGYDEFARRYPRHHRGAY